MRVPLFVLALTLLAAPAFAQAPADPVAPSAAPEAPAPASPRAAVPPASPREGIATVVRSLGRSTADREIEEVTLHAVPVVISPVRGRTEQVSEIVRAGLGELRAAMVAAGFGPSGPAMTVYLEIGDTDFSAELMIPIAELPVTPPPQGMRIGQSPEGRALRIVHPGAYEEMNDTYDQLSTFIEDQDLQVRDVVMERYLNDLDETEPDELRTELYVLLR